MRFFSGLWHRCELWPSAWNAEVSQLFNVGRCIGLWHLPLLQHTSERLETPGDEPFSGNDTVDMLNQPYLANVEDGNAQY